jgi:hypothetical protein
MVKCVRSVLAAGCRCRPEAAIELKVDVRISWAQLAGLPNYRVSVLPHISSK